MPDPFTGENNYYHPNDYGYAELAPYKLRTPSEREALIQFRKRMLYRVLNQRTLVVFAGSGLSRTLGYPTWQELTSEVVKDTLRSLRGRPENDDKRRITRFKKRLESRKRDNEELVFMLGECQRMLRRKRQQDSERNGRQDTPILENLLKRLFMLPGRRIPQKRAQEYQFRRGFIGRREKKDSNPYLALMELPVERFITSNYDCEIEWALHDKRKISWSELGVPDPDKGDKGEKSPSERWHSFTQARKYSEHLALFAMSRVKDAANMVFHCHGRCDEPKDLVLSEGDYQRWYFGNRAGEGTTFRQTIDLLFGANPILFLGFGMEDDIARPLRMMSAIAPELKENRPLFALMDHDTSSKGKQDEGWEKFDRLYERYGLHVIPFERPKSDEWGGKWCEVIDELNKGYRDWESGALKKPWIRGIDIRMQEEKRTCTYLHHDVRPRQPGNGNKGEAGDSITEKHIEKLQELIEKYKVLVILGPGGSGKSWLATELVHCLAKDLGDKKFDGVFFWSCYYSDDSLTCVDYALKFVKLYEKEPRGRKPAKQSPAESDLFDIGKRMLDGRYEKLKNALQGKRYLLVFDGIERLLRQSHRPDCGYAYSSNVRAFLKAISYAKSKSTVILTSRLWPLEFSQPKEGFSGKSVWEAPAGESTQSLAKETNEVHRLAGHRMLHHAAGIPMDVHDGVHPYPMGELTAEDIRDKGRFKELASLVDDPRESKGDPHEGKGDLHEGKGDLHESKDDLLRSFCRLIEGNAYAAHLACAFLSTDDNDKKQQEKAFSDLYAKLLHTPPDRRVSRMIREVLALADKKHAKKAHVRPVSELLGVLAVFMSPISEDIVGCCWKQLVASKKVDENTNLEEIKTTLKGSRLMQMVKVGNSQDAYTVHPTVRGYVFQNLHNSGSDSLPSLTLPGFTAAGVDVHPGSRKAAVMVVSMAERLIQEGEATLDSLKNTDQTLDAETRNKALDYCRSAFGAIRSRMAANTVARWGTYDEYFRLLVRLGNFARRIPQKRWDFGFCQHTSDQKEEGPLYADELAWLYNEMGIACYAEGSMPDALGSWEQGYAVNRIIDGVGNDGPYVVQSYCNLGAANIEYGRLPLAEEYLRRALGASYDLEDHDHAGRLLGYLGLVAHLRGNLSEAESLYGKALTEIGDENARARSIFLFHRCNLRIKLDRHEEAEADARASKALADAANYPDLAAFARCALGHAFRRQKRYSEAVLEYNSAMETAKRIGSRKLQSEILSEFSRLALQLGENELARRRAIEALKIANELVLGLRQTHGLCVLGKATVKTGERRLGISYLRHAKRLADAQQYWLRGAEAEEELHRLGERVEIPPDGEESSYPFFDAS